MARVKKLSNEEQVSNGEYSDRFESFLGLFEELITEITNSARKSLEDSDSKELVDIYSGTVITQVKELSSFLRGEFSRLPDKGKLDVDQVLRIYAGETLLRSSIPAAKNITTPAKALGLADIIREIKKIIKGIIVIFFPNWQPPWLDRLFVLIDEILDLIFGLIFPKLAKTLSEAEISYLRELYALRRLEILEEQRRNLENRDDD